MGDYEIACLGGDLRMIPQGFGYGGNVEAEILCQVAKSHPFMEFY
jgi:hypothetical protein